MYNGWKNRQTWNVVLWLDNDEFLYRQARAWVQLRKAAGRSILWTHLIKYLGLNGERTPDGIAWNGTRLDYPALNQHLKDNYV